MKQLTIEHLAAYLPYGVKVSCKLFADQRSDLPLVVLNPFADIRHGITINDVQHYDGRLILRPLSQLTEVIEHNGERFVPMERIKELGLMPLAIATAKSGDDLPYSVVTYLQSLHFDTFDLIEAGLAEPIKS
jgi:hypothetical protein